MKNFVICLFKKKIGCAYQGEKGEGFNRRGSLQKRRKNFRSENLNSEQMDDIKMDLSGGGWM